ncbi:MAG: hypothetical protein LBM65_06625 [Oscillospiraceae bacterium]|nr:hypothetical protein [Oscillospiraceae bacterium]
MISEFITLRYRERAKTIKNNYAQAHSQEYIIFKKEYRKFYRSVIYSKRQALIISKYILKELGNPQDKMKSVIHVTGSNGKGSVCSYLQAILAANGYRVNRFSTPYLINITETIVLNNKPISEDLYIKYGNKIISTYKKIINRNLLQKELENAKITDALKGINTQTKKFNNNLFWATFIPLVFLAMSECPADFNIIEVILGGKDDFTNVFAPENTAATVINNIKYGDGNHKWFLALFNNGKWEDNILTVTQHKALLGKKNVPMIVANQSEEVLKEIRHIASTVIGTKTIEYGRDWQIENATDSGFDFVYGGIRTSVPNNKKLLGRFKTQNLATSLACLAVLEKNQKLKLDLDLIKTGIQNSIEIARPQLVFDSYFNNYFGGSIEIAIGVIKRNSDGITPFKDLLAATPQYINFLIFTTADRGNKDSTLFVAFIRKYFAKGKRLVTYRSLPESYKGLELVQKAMRENNIDFEEKGTLQQAMEFVKLKTEEIIKKEPQTKIRIIIACESMINFDKNIYYLGLPKDVLENERW